MRSTIIRFTVLFLFFQVFTQVQAQEYKRHTVEKGETLSSISRKYGVSVEELYRLNPDAQQGIKERMVLVIPATDEIEPTGFKRHRVKRKETIFGIAQQYGIQISDIKRYNKELYSRALKRGERIRIPVFPQRVEEPIVKIPSDEGKEFIHTVAAGETVYGIARHYGMTIDQLREINNDLGNTLAIGTRLRVLPKAVTESAVIDEDQFQLYEIAPKEGFFRLKVKFGLDQAEIIALNPYAADGLKEGMILKLPRQQNTKGIGGDRIVDLQNTINNRSSKRLAVMLPFQLRSIQQDSIEYNTEILEMNGAMRVALDFYSGVLMAAEFATEKGIPVELDVYDTAGDPNDVAMIIDENDFDKIDAVIGPLLSNNVERAASTLKHSDTPIFSPLSNREIKASSNLFQTLPSDKMLEEAMLEFLKDSAVGKKLFIISDIRHVDQKNAILQVLPQAELISPRDEGFLMIGDIKDRISEEDENWFILLSDNPITVSNVIGLLNGLPEEFRVRLLTLNRNNAYSYDDVSNQHLAKLRFTFPSVSKGVDYLEKNAFITSYKNRYGVLPNRFAIRGFDVTYDVLLRLASAGDVYRANDGSLVTAYTENKFSYSKKLFSGYQNQAFYILKYNQDLTFEVVR